MIGSWYKSQLPIRGPLLVKGVGTFFVKLELDQSAKNTKKMGGRKPGDEVARRTRQRLGFI